MTDEQENSPQDVILGALRLAKERVIGELEPKEIARERLADLIVRVGMYGGTPAAAERPTAADIAEALGYPEDRNLGKALRAWA